MQVILMKSVPNLGSTGDLVNVKNGYARNFLIPNGFAKLASSTNVAQLEHDKRIATHRAAKELGEAESLAKVLSGLELTLSRKAGEQDKLFGSVTTIDIEKALSDKGYTIARRQIHLAEPIKALGSYEVAVKLHHDVEAKLKLNIAGE